MAGIALTREDIERASRREMSHPVVSVLEYHEPRIVQLNDGYSQINDTHEQQVYIAGNFGFLGDALEEAGDFSVGPLDLVAIWSKVLSIDLCTRYAFAGMLSASYGIQGRPDLKGLSRYYLENSRLPKLLVANRPGLLQVRERVRHISRSLDDLHLYVFGVENPMGVIAQLTKREIAGDEEAGKEIERLIEHGKERQTQILSELQENSQGRIPFVFALDRAIEETE